MKRAAACFASLHWKLKSTCSGCLGYDAHFRGPQQVDPWSRTRLELVPRLVNLTSCSRSILTIESPFILLVRRSVLSALLDHEFGLNQRNYTKFMNSFQQGVKSYEMHNDCNSKVTVCKYPTVPELVYECGAKNYRKTEITIF